MAFTNNDIRTSVSTFKMSANDYTNIPIARIQMSSNKLLLKSKQNDTLHNPTAANAEKFCVETWAAVSVVLCRNFDFRQIWSLHGTGTEPEVHSCHLQQSRSIDLDTHLIYFCCNHNLNEDILRISIGNCILFEVPEKLYRQFGDPWLGEGHMRHDLQDP